MKKRKIAIFRVAAVLLAALCLAACGDDFLEAKPDKKLVVPVSVSDFQAMLDNTYIMNYQTMSPLGEVSSDDYYTTDALYASIVSPATKNAYVWSRDIFEGDETATDWSRSYQCVFYANTVLTGLEGLTPGAAEREQYDHVKGGALFFRSWAFYHLAQLFCMPYSDATASSDPGIPLRLDPDISIPSERATVYEVYERIIADLKAAAACLPPLPVVKTRPSKAAAFALLSRTFLLTGAYGQSYLYADSALQITGELLAHTEINPAASLPYAKFNKEVIFSNTMISSPALTTSRLIVDPGLYDSYDDRDIRKRAYYYENSGRLTFKGSYEGDRTLFNGLATGELYLIRAECNAREGRTEAALDDLDRLRRARIEGYNEAVAGDQQALLRQILAERRKELVFRGIRWSDIRRLSAEPLLAVTPERTLNGVRYVLEPGSKRYALSIPWQVIAMTGMAQNER